MLILATDLLIIVAVKTQSVIELEIIVDISYVLAFMSITDRGINTSCLGTSRIGLISHKAFGLLRGDIRNAKPYDM